MSRAIGLKAPMVDWYEPRELARTAYQVFLSTIFGRHADRRLMQVGAAAETESEVELYFDFSKADGPFWFDYVADVGDGFDSTCTIATYLARPTLNIGNPNKKGKPEATERGRLLVFGGDEVYPAASPETYRERLVKPYCAAWSAANDGAEAASAAEDPPAVFAIPGNHDWYDSLVSFTELFLRGEDFCGWRTMQRRSYFALRLPRGWWLFGTDTQLGSSLDRPQVDYFASVMKEVPPSDRIILCNAEPYWINAHLDKSGPGFTDQQMTYFTQDVLRDQVEVFIAGDRHYYRRHEEVAAGDRGRPTRRQKITAGGGGAFLHPTHNEDVDRIGSPAYKLKKSFPDPRVSKRLGYWNLLFPLWNPSFGLLTAVLYLLTARAFLSKIGHFGWDSFHLALREVLHDTLTEPFSLYWVLLFFIGFIFFTDTSSRIYRWIAGPLHAVAHLAATFILSWQVSYWLSGGRGLDFDSVLELLMASTLIFIGGWIIGSAILGLYLFTSLNLFGRHHNDAFSALKIADYKNFLRLKLDEDGDLLIYPVGVERAIRKWTFSHGPDGLRAEPRKAEEKNLPFLIEEPIRVEGAGKANGTNSSSGAPAAADSGTPVAI